MISQIWVRTRITVKLVLDMLRSGRLAVQRGEYFWLMLLKNSQILLEDSRADRLSWTCWGSEKVEEV